MLSSFKMLRKQKQAALSIAALCLVHNSAKQKQIPSVHITYMYCIVSTRLSYCYVHPSHV